MLGQIIFKIIGDIILGIGLFVIGAAQPLIALITLKYLDKKLKEDR